MKAMRNVDLFLTGLLSTDITDPEKDDNSETDCHYSMCYFHSFLTILGRGKSRLTICQILC